MSVVCRIHPVTSSNAFTFITALSGVVFLWLAGLALTYGLVLAVGAAFPAMPVEFSISLVFVSMAVSIATGIVSGFAPAYGASRLDPVVALRYE